MKFIYLLMSSIMFFKSSSQSLRYKIVCNQERFLHMKKDSFKNLYSLYYPKTENQKKYVKYLDNKNTSLLIVTGPAGTGKTLFACTSAINELKAGNINKIILTRPVVPVEGEELGFLPGDIKKKMDPWTRPIFDILLEHYSQKDLDSLIQKGAIEICPLAYMRGRTFKRSFIIADEMQNSSPNQMKMITTRIGKNSKMIITGDVTQTDLIFDDKTRENGLSDIMKRIKQNMERSNTDRELIKLIELDSTDIERSEVVVKILDLYDSKPLEKEHFVKLKNIEDNDTQLRYIKKPGYNYNNRSASDAALIPLAQEKNIEKYWWDAP